MTGVLNAGACWHSNARALLERPSLSAKASLALCGSRLGAENNYPIVTNSQPHAVVRPSCMVEIKHVHLHIINYI